MKILVAALVFSMTVPVFAAVPQTLRIAFVQEWGAFNPLYNQLASTEAMWPFVLRKVTKRSATGAVEPDLVESIPPLVNKKAKWVFRKDANWGDGTPVTCADFALSWRAGLSPNVGVAERVNYSKIANVEWDEKTPKICTVTYTEDSWLYDRDLPFPIPKHLEGAIFDANKDKPEGYDRASLYVSDPTNKGLYNGPFMVSEFKFGGHAMLVRNPHFFGKKSPIERVILQHISDTSTLRANLVTDKIDVISAVGFPPDAAISLDEDLEKSKGKHKVRFQVSAIFQGMFFNHENEILKDVKVREAISRAIDKEQLAKAFFRGKMPAAENMLSPTHTAFKKRKTVFDRAKARKLLDDAGWKLGTDGVRAKDGKKLSFVFKTSAGIKVLENIQGYVCGQLKEIGVACSIKNEPPRVLLGTSTVRGDFDFAMFGHPVPPDSSMTSVYASSSIPSAANSWAGMNNGRINWKELDELLVRFDKEKDKKKRDRLATDIESLMLDRFAYVPLYHRSEACVFPRGMEGMTDSFEGTGFKDPENWN